MTRLRLLLCAAAWVLAGCATPQAERLLRQPAGLPAAHQLQVPFVAQTDDTCGPAALAMTLAHAGRPADANQLTREVQLPGRSGSLQAEMLATARRHGLLALRLEPSLEQVLQYVSDGYPVIALVNLNFSWSPRWHYVVLTGYDLQGQTVWVHSASEARQPWSLTQFERLWARSQHWAFVPLQPGRMPPAAQPWSYVKAALDLEHTAGLAAAAPAWQAAAERWPDNLSALIGAGNGAWQRGEREVARQWYAAAVEKHPTSPVAANNLAHVLFEMGQRAQAREWAVRAIELGGGPAARETLQQIDSAP